MSFEIRNVLWTPIDEVAKEELQPIVSTLSDWKLGEQVIEAVGLTKARAGLMDSPFPECRDFKNGRIILASAIDLLVVARAMPSENERFKWFNVGSHVIQLFRQSQETCGGIRKQAGVHIFGPLERVDK